MKLLLRIIHSIFLYSFAVVSLAITITIASYFALFTRSKTKPFQTAARLWARFVTAFSGVTIKVAGFENVPQDRAVLFVPNHQSYADDIITLACIPINFRFLIAKEYFKLPVFGWGWRKAGYCPIDRKSSPLAYQTLEKIVEIMKTGESFLIFPEGTRSKTRKFGKLKRGSLQVALNSGAPIIPIAISGSFHILPRGSWIIKPHPIKFSFGNPIYIRSEAEYKQKLEEVREAIARML